MVAALAALLREMGWIARWGGLLRESASLLVRVRAIGSDPFASLAYFWKWKRPRSRCTGHNSSMLSAS